MRQYHRQRPPVLPHLRSQALRRLCAVPLGIKTAIAFLGAMILSWSLAVAPVNAAEILQVRGPTLLQLGDGNRSYTVQLGCLQVPPAGQQAATEWLRQTLPRRSRVNLRPLGQREGVLLARITLLDGGTPKDLASAMIDAGLAESVPCPQA